MPPEGIDCLLAPGIITSGEKGNSYPLGGSNSRGPSTGAGAEGALNEVRNRADQLGANAIRVISVDSDELSRTAVAEALSRNPVKLGIQ
jgi:hypothetical protein